ncbi:uncharacterized protein si:ch211-113e8.11 [Plectropomus leopardus]|uniref:uncharacterized protein si:ch211-113e8.11 n=1 Tax=Plectropomus leopardus TaxID=160734 RepID=UPI001C4CAFFE|nr:uncharacterized protein si:ch211-113e8.11 [Plectropomus leopardus]
MNSLVGYGVSSESDSDGEDGNKDGVGCVKEVCDEASAAKKSRNFLLESGSASSESESEEEDTQTSSLIPLTQKPESSSACQSRVSAPSLGPLSSSKLPPPPLHTCSDSSVFANPFKAQAEQKLSALQKHVPLTMHAKPSHIGGKRMCVSYRKDGRCRFGIKCKFAHDSDLQTDIHTPVSEDTPVSDQSHAGEGSQNPRQDIKEEESGGQQVKKRKVGLSNTLIPPKRAMKQYTMQREREQVNMS